MLGLAAATAGPSVAEDWSVQRDPFDRAVVARYRALLARDPHDRDAVRKLVALYRQYRSVSELEAAYQGDEVANVIVRGEIALVLGDDAGARVALEQVVAMEPSDAVAWLALGGVYTRHHETYRAQNAFAEAADRASTKLVRTAALRGWLAVISSAAERLVVVQRLVDDTQTDGGLRLELGDAQRDDGDVTTALATYAEAEALFATDPDRRLDAIARRAAAFEQDKRDDDAAAELRRGLALAPRGRDRDFVQRLVEVERRRRRLAPLLLELAGRWPTRSRGVFEWTTLADLYETTGDDAAAITALERATVIAPREQALQFRLIALYDTSRQEARGLARLERVARAVPRDLTVQLALARRYGRDDARSTAVLDRVTRIYRTEIDALSLIASFEIAWQRPDRAEQLFATAADVLTRRRDAPALDALGERLLDLGLWTPALRAFTASLAITPTAHAWIGRARAADGLESWVEAFAAMQEALYVIGESVEARAARWAAKTVFVQIILRSRRDMPEYADSYVKSWEWAVDQDDDVDALYSLAVFHLRSQDLENVDPARDEPYRSLLRLHQRVPDDAIVVAELARAKATHLARFPPGERISYVPFVREPEDPPPDPVGVRRRIGIHLGAGVGVAGDMPLTLACGATVQHLLGNGFALAVRGDYTQRTNDTGSAHGLAVAASLTKAVVRGTRGAFVVGIGERVEARWGDELAMTSWGNLGAAVDFSSELVLRDVPFTVGARVESWHSGRVIGLFELGWELR